MMSQTIITVDQGGCVLVTHRCHKHWVTKMTKTWWSTISVTPPRVTRVPRSVDTGENRYRGTRVPGMLDSILADGPVHYDPKMCLAAVFICCCLSACISSFCFARPRRTDHRVGNVAQDPGQTRPRDRGIVPRSLHIRMVADAEPNGTRLPESECGV